MHISKRQKVELRDVWSQETGFSDWLASPEGLEFVQSELGISIENARRECREGDFRCDSERS